MATEGWRIPLLKIQRQPESRQYIVSVESYFKSQGMLRAFSICLLCFYNDFVYMISVVIFICSIVNCNKYIKGVIEHERLSNLQNLERTWWMLFQKHVVWTKLDIVRTIFDIYVFMRYQWLLDYNVNSGLLFYNFYEAFFTYVIYNVWISLNKR